jgi:hypothetical protein
MGTLIFELQKQGITPKKTKKPVKQNECAKFLSVN